MINRKRYLLFNKKEWEKFKSKVDETDVNKEKALEKSQYVKKLIEDSENLMRDWDDTYEKILAKQEEDREKRKNAENESRMNFYRQYLEQKRIERKNMLEQAEEFNFRQRDEPKTLMSSLICAETLRQIDVQRRFNEQMRREQREEELQKATDVKEHAEEWANVLRERSNKRRDKNMEVATYVKKQYEDKMKHEKEERLARIAREKQDIEKANEEMAILKQHDINTKLKYKQFVKNQGDMAIEMVQKRKHENKVLEEMEDKMIEVYLAVTCKIEHTTKDKLRQVAEEKERFNELTRSRFPRKEAILWAKEEKSMKKAQQEYERKEIENINMKKAKHEAMMEDKRKCHEEWLKKQAEQNENEDALKKWEIANRLQNEELTKEFYERERILKMKQMKEYTDFLDQQMKELEAKKKAEKEELYDFYHTQRLNSLKNINDKFVTYATDLIEECKEFGRPTRPLEKVLADYKAKYMAPPRKIPSRYLKPCPTKITTKTNS